MKNFVEYFYGIKVDNIIFNEKYYYFVHNHHIYKLYIIDDRTDTIFLYEVSKKLITNTLISEIIINVNGEIISRYLNINYILIKIFVNIKKQITLEEINFISSFLFTENIVVNWGNLWEKKIDFLEDVINENGKRYPLIVDSFNYFIGMAENAISYFNSIIINKDYKYVISHKKIKWDDTIDVLYNPINMIFDYRVRDIAEYIKNSFFNHNQNIFTELIMYLKNNILTLIDVKLLISRLLYPSFCFDLYEAVLLDNKQEKILLELISRIDDYEKYLGQVISLLKTNYDICEIEWLKKR